MIWYQREILIPSEWEGKRVLIHFGAVDYESEVYIDGRSVGRHWGGTSSFSHDITSAVRPGEKHSLVVYVRDETRSGVQPAGKQCPAEVAPDEAGTSGHQHPHGRPSVSLPPRG